MFKAVPCDLSCEVFIVGAGKERCRCSGWHRVSVLTRVYECRYEELRLTVTLSSTPGTPSKVTASWNTNKPQAGSQDAFFVFFFLLYGARFAFSYIFVSVSLSLSLFRCVFLCNIFCCLYFYCFVFFHFPFCLRPSGRVLLDGCRSVITSYVFLFFSFFLFF